MTTEKQLVFFETISADAKSTGFGNDGQSD